MCKKKCHNHTTFENSVISHHVVLNRYDILSFWEKYNFSVVSHFFFVQWGSNVVWFPTFFNVYYTIHQVCALYHCGHICGHSFCSQNHSAQQEPPYVHRDISYFMFIFNNKHFMFLYLVFSLQNVCFQW